MRGEVRVLRACVWLPCVARDGFLALVRALEPSPQMQVTHGSLALDEEKDATAGGSRRHGEGTKRYAMQPIRWGDIDASERPGMASRSRVVVVVDDGTAGVVPVEVLVFSLASPRPRREKQRIAFVGVASLELNAKDLEAVDGSQEVVFKAPLAGDAGSVEIALRRVDGDDDGKTARQPEGEGGSFSVHWTSSEALEKDMKAKETPRLETEQKLVQRLAAVEASAKRVVALRDQAVQLLRRKRAAVAVQRCYRGLCRTRREERRRQTQEQDEAERARKAALRAKVVARNHQRTQRLIQQWTQVRGSEDPARKGDSGDVDEWVRQEEEAMRCKLETKLARLRAERDRRLEELEEDVALVGGQRGVRFEDATEASPALFSDGLVHAIQRLHVRK